MRITLPEPKRFCKVFKNVTNILLENPISGISTDSRECIDGDLYIAIKGETVDGHNFITEAQSNGAVAALINRPNEVINDIQQLIVDDPIKCIGQVANAWRKKYNIPVIGITGSNGKTTTKDLIKHFLESKYTVHSTKGNFNTSIGVPLTLLQMQGKHNFSIIEMGANQPGDIKTLCKIVEPTDGLITNIAPAHLEGFGSIEHVALEKSELFTYLTNGTAYINILDEWISSFTIQAKSKVYGDSIDCDYYASHNRESDGNIILTINENELNIKSKNIVLAKNILAASAVANSLGIDWNAIRERVLTFTPTYGRGGVIKYENITVINDTYNANYMSTIAAIEHLAQYPTDNGRRIFVFGDMAELGKSSELYHQKVGKKCIEKNLDAVFTVGTQTNFTDKAVGTLRNHKHYDDKSILAKELKSFINNNDVVLFKGSRSMEMEKIIMEIFKK